MSNYHAKPSTSHTRLSPVKPDIYEIKEGRGSIVILGAHNGFDVPENLYTADGDPLGVSADWFSPAHENKRHEACDWGMKALFNGLNVALCDLDCSVLTAKHSRLVCDLNREPNQAITTRADELGVAIPLNNALSENDKASRLSTFYAPWFTAIEHLTRRAKEHNAGKVLILDLHSFTPTWNGVQRDVDIGTLKLEETTLSNLAEAFYAKACKENNLKFKPDAPYNMQTLKYREKLVANSLCKKFDVAYLGVEIRNDYLQTPDRLEAVTKIIAQSASRLSAYLHTLPSPQNYHHFDTPAPS